MAQPSSLLAQKFGCVVADSARVLSPRLAEMEPEGVVKETGQLNVGAAVAPMWMMSRPVQELEQAARRARVH